MKAKGFVPPLLRLQTRRVRAKVTADGRIPMVYTVDGKLIAHDTWTEAPVSPGLIQALKFGDLEEDLGAAVTPAKGAVKRTVLVTKVSKTRAKAETRPKAKTKARPKTKTRTKPKTPGAIKAKSVRRLRPGPRNPSWQILFKHFDSEVEKNGKYPTHYKAAQAVIEFAKSKPLAIDPRTIERGIPKYRPDWAEAESEA
jgi:hypothetical protein